MKKRLLSAVTALCLAVTLLAGLAPSARAADDTIKGYLVPYTVQAGDTIYGICQAKGLNFDANLTRIAHINGLTNFNYMVPGKVLWLPMDTAPEKAGYYTLLSHTLVYGETPAALCQSYGIDYNKSYNMLSALNDNLGTFMAGQTFVLPRYSNASATAKPSAEGTASGPDTTTGAGYAAGGEGAGSTGAGYAAGGPGTGSGAKPAEKVAALKQALAAGAIIVILAALAFGIASCGGGGEREKPAPMAIAMATGEAVDLGNYGDFFGIPFGLAFQAPPVPGQDLGFGKVANVALGGGIFEVELAKPLFKVFPKVRVELADGLESRRIVRLNFERDGEGVDAAKARKVVEKIASLIGNKYKIDFGDLQVGIDDTYFSQKYSDTDIDIRISCAVSQDSTSIFFTVENRRVRALAQ